MKIALGFFLAMAIGMICRLAGIPVPAPPALVGALLVVAMTTGYIVMGRYATRRSSSHQHLCGGPTGSTTNEEA